MSCIVRQVEPKDLSDLYELSKQFVLLNLPSDQSTIKKKIEASVKSFSDPKIDRAKAKYIFVLEDMDKQKVVGCSMVIAKHGTPETPHYCFKIITRRKNSEDLGVGFEHHLLRLSEDTDGPTEIGGLLLDKEYRKEKSKLGRLISLARFPFMKLNESRFEKRVLCEFAPLLGPSGESFLWEELGRKFTGLSYEDADRLSLKSKEFIKDLFPVEAVYLSLLSHNVRQNLGKVSVKTEPAKHMIEKIGFEYLNEIDPFDGGPHFGAKLKDIKYIKNARQGVVDFGELSEGNPRFVVSATLDGKYYCVYGYGTSENVIISKDYQSFFTNATNVMVTEL